MTKINGYEIKPYADLRGAELEGADLEGADLWGAYLGGANLYGAYLRYANIRDADLYGANLEGAILYGASLQGANLEGARLPHFQLVPEEGSFIGWKKTLDGSIVKLLIPEDAQRTSSLVGRKCRASKAIVLEGEGYSSHAGASFKYEKGMTVVPDKYDPDIRVECTHGIHFFITRKEAEEY